VTKLDLPTPTISLTIDVPVVLALLAGFEAMGS
jgi:hypothetical protein